MRRTANRRVPLRERLADLLGGWTTVYCPNPRCSMRIRYRHANPADALRYQELVADHGRRCDAA